MQNVTQIHEFQFKNLNKTLCIKTQLVQRIKCSTYHGIPQKSRHICTGSLLIEINHPRVASTSQLRKCSVSHWDYHYTEVLLHLTHRHLKNF